MIWMAFQQLKLQRRAPNVLVQRFTFLCTHTHTFLPADAYQRAQFHCFLPATHRPQLCHFNMHWVIEARDVSVLHSQLYDAFIVLFFFKLPRKTSCIQHLVYDPFE